MELIFHNVRPKVNEHLLNNRRKENYVRENLILGGRADEKNWKKNWI